MRLLRRIYNRIRFGKVCAFIKAEVNGHVTEMAFYDRRGNMVGYWAYGKFDSSMPYRDD